MTNHVKKIAFLTTNVILRYFIIIVGYILSSIYFYFIFNSQYIKNTPPMINTDYSSLDTNSIMHVLYIFFIWNITGFFYIAVICPFIGAFTRKWSNLILGIIAIHSLWFFRDYIQSPDVAASLIAVGMFPAIIGAAIALKLKIRDSYVN